MKAPEPEVADIAHSSAIAAYTQATQTAPVRQPITTVDAIMSRRVFTIADSANVEEAWRTLSHEGFGQAPVVDGDGVLVGLIARADLLHLDQLPGPEALAVAWRAFMAQNVADIMVTPVPCVTNDTDVRRVAQVLLDTDLPGLPVADDDGKVIGFISRVDILRAVVADPPLDLWT